MHCAYKHGRLNSYSTPSEMRICLMIADGEQLPSTFPDRFNLIQKVSNKYGQATMVFRCVLASVILAESTNGSAMEY